MLQRIRDRVSGWIAGLVIVLVAGAFILFGIEFYFEQGPVSQGDAAKVNGVTITNQQVNTIFSQMQQQAMIQTGGRALSSAEEKQLKSYALQSRITQTALLTTLQKDGFHVGLKQVKAMVEEAPDFQVQGQFSQDKLLQAIQNLGVSPLQFFQQLQANWIIQQATNGVADAGFALPNEVARFYSLIHQKRSFGYLIIPSQLFLAKATASEKEISDYYQNHQTLYQTQPTVSVAYLVLSPRDIEKKITITTEEAKAYYDSHIDHNQTTKKTTFAAEENNIISLLKRQHVNQILSDQGNQLSDLTYTHPDSLDAASKALNLPIQTTPMMTKTGEKTGIFSNPKILEAVFSDSVYQSGNNSNPIALPNGDQVVVRVVKKEPSKPIPFKTVHDQIQKALQEQNAQAQAGLLAYQLQKKINGGVDPVLLAKQHALQWHTVPLMTANQTTLAPRDIISAAFATPATMQHKPFLGSQAIVLNQQGYAVVAISKIEDANPLHASAADKHKIFTHLSALWGQLYQHYFVDSMVQESKIKVMTT